MPRPFRRLAVACPGLITALAFMPSAVPTASAVTMSIDSQYVMARNCVAVTSGEPNSVGIKFRCPAPPAGPNFADCNQTGGDTAPGAPDGWPDLMQPQCGNISNDPHIEFESSYHSGCWFSAGGNFRLAAPQNGTIGHNVCNDMVFLCGAIKYTNETPDALTIDEMAFEIFKFQDGSNQNDPGSTPPLKSYFIDNPGTMVNGTSAVLTPTCVLFDGAVNVQGELGKTNGTYGYRTRAKTQIQSGTSGNITITTERSYPGSTALDANLNLTPQKPVTVEVTNVHVLVASTTVVGRITGVAAQPYNFNYRLSKDATMYIKIYNAMDTTNVVRDVLPGVPRSGEGVPKGTLLNGDSWNGRANNGDLAAPGLYLATFAAESRDQYGDDLSYTTTRQIGLDPLHATDIRVSPLLAGSTSLATLTYVLTEPATVYIDIYPPDTQFCAGLNDLHNNTALDQTADPSMPPKDFDPRLSSCVGGTDLVPLRRIVEHKSSRSDVVSFWDGTDELGNALPDGDYVFVIYAALASQNGAAFGGNNNDRRIWTSLAKTGWISIIRGFVGITQVTPASTVVGSSPSVAGLNPFYFKYTLSREAIVTLKIYDETGTTLVKTLVENEQRPGLFHNQETWYDGTDNNGVVVTSGTYLVRLTAADPMFPAKVSTTTAQFPVNLFRITDVMTTALLSGASDVVTLTYQLSQTMNMAWNIYPPGTTIVRSSGTWPPCGSITPATGCNQVLRDGQPVSPIISFSGLRVGRLKYTEYWDGRDQDGLFVPDGSYGFTLAAQSTTTPKYFATDKIMGTVSVARGRIIFTSFAVVPDIPVLHNSSDTVSLHPYTIEYGLTRQSSVTIQILTTTLPSTIVRTVAAGAVRDANVLLQDTWDGRDANGNFLRTGFYNVRAVAEDLASVLSSGSTSQITITYEPLRIYDVAVAPLRADSPAGIVAYQLSETMKISLKIFKPGTIFDGAGNPSPGEATSLVKRIVGIRPARTLIEESWNGTDLNQSIVPDGNYKFKLVASTDANAIDDLTGDVLIPEALALDRPRDELPVVRLGSVDPFADFQTNSYIYPNPVKGSSARVRIYVPIQGRVKMKLYTMSGGMVLEKDFGERDLDSYVEYDWNRINSDGHEVARGMYWAVLRIEETLGGRNVLQVVKKILVQ